MGLPWKKPSSFLPRTFHLLFPWSPLWFPVNVTSSTQSSPQVTTTGFCLISCTTISLTYLLIIYPPKCKLRELLSALFICQVSGAKKRTHSIEGTPKSLLNECTNSEFTRTDYKKFTFGSLYQVGKDIELLHSDGEGGD